MPQPTDVVPTQTTWVKWPDDIDINVEYLGANIQVHMHIDKKGVFTRDRDVKQVYDLARLRVAPQAELSGYIKKQIDEVMQK